MKLKNKKIYSFFRIIVYLLIIHPHELLKEKLRVKNILKDTKYLKTFKNVHNGQRCFIIATGPSLTEEDYIMLKDEYTIGVNGLCLWFGNNIPETNYFVVSDDDVYKRIEETLSNLKTSKIFVSERIKKKYSISEKFYIIPVNIWNRFISKIKYKKLSNDISICSYDEETVVFHAIQLAIYLGFSKIYLVGTDCNYKGNKKYAVDHGKSVNPDIGDNMIMSYKVVKKYERKYNFKVFNATRGGKLEVFPRVNLDKIVKENSL